MNWAHIHLSLNHLPVVGTFFGVLLLLLALLRKSEELKRVSLGVFVLTALLALPVYFTGEPPTIVWSPGRIAPTSPVIGLSETA
jgi:asparagine N-glycosylation enzyme membrane subunit Stt3